MPLFKYCGESGLKVLTNLEIKVTPPIECNDPFEFSPVVSCGDREAQALRDTQRVIDHPAFFQANRASFPQCRDFGEFQSFVRTNFNRVADSIEAETPKMDSQFQEEILSTFSEKFGVICFSSAPTEHLMWAHYASSHTGILIEFDETNKVFNNPSFVRVDYHADRATYDPDGGSNAGAVATFARRKSLHWSYEKESRLIVDLALTRKVAGTPPMFLLSIEPKLIKSVTFGLRSSAAVREEVLALASTPPLLHMEVFRIEADSNAFKLHRRKIK